MARRGLPFELTIAKPCSESWATMQGDGRSRHCGHCRKTVHNLAAMTARDVEALVGRSAGEICARITRRGDGSLVMLETKPRSSAIAQVAATALLTVGAAGVAAQSKAVSDAVPQAGRVLPQKDTTNVHAATVTTGQQEVLPTPVSQIAVEPEPRALMGSVVVVASDSPESNPIPILSVFENEPLVRMKETSVTRARYSFSYALLHPIQYVKHLRSKS